MLCIVYYFREHSYISLNQVNTQGKIVSHISLYDYPNVPALPQCQWLDWINGLYTMSQATNRNTLFVHLLVWDPSYVQEFLRVMLDSLFMNYNYLQHIVLVVPPGAPVRKYINQSTYFILNNNNCTLLKINYVISSILQ